MKDVQNYFSGFNVGCPGVYENLILFPLHREEATVTEYLMLDEALTKGTITVSEVNETGMVSELRVKNDGDIAFLLLDGEELVGAKQDRILNTTILVAPHSTIIIPVSCVEQGRWHYRSRTFYTEDRMYKPTYRGKKAKRVFASVRMGAGFNAGQSEVWDEVACLHKRFGNRSKTFAMSSVYDDQRGNLDAYTKGFAITEGQTGFVALINGKIIGLEALSRPDAFRHAWPKLIKSYALDAIDMRMNNGDSHIPPLEKGDKGEAEHSSESITAWISSINPQDISTHKSPGLGDDLRWDEAGTVGFMLDYSNEVIHTAVFRMEVK